MCPPRGLWPGTNLLNDCFYYNRPICRFPAIFQEVYPHLGFGCYERGHAQKRLTSQSDSTYNGRSGFVRENGLSLLKGQRTVFVDGG